jgi:hypothetical protein
MQSSDFTFASQSQHSISSARYLCWTLRLNCILFCSRGYVPVRSAFLVASIRHLVAVRRSYRVFGGNALASTRVETGSVPLPFFIEVFWLAKPYMLVALACILRSARARKWFDASVVFVALIVAALASYGRFVEPNQLNVEETTIENGSSARIALISDLRVGLFQGHGRAQQVVDALNKLDVDAVLVAGDWTYEPNKPIAEFLSPLSRCRHRVLSVPVTTTRKCRGHRLLLNSKQRSFKTRYCRSRERSNMFVTFKSWVWRSLGAEGSHPARARYFVAHHCARTQSRFRRQT